MSCARCSSVVKDVVHWGCTTCLSVLCEPCFFEHSHEHPMTKKDPGQKSSSLFSVEDPITGNFVYLGNLAAAEPRSATLSSSSIKCVVSCVTWSELERKQADSQLYSIYGKEANTTAQHDGILYHRLEVEDVSAPQFLSHSMFLEEATVFLDSALTRGSVLIHCVQGEKRSPTALLAWLCTRGWKPGDAIRLIGQTYSGRSGWEDNYRDTRKGWIQELNKWVTSWRDRQRDFASKITIKKSK